MGTNTFIGKRNKKNAVRNNNGRQDKVTRILHRKFLCVKKLQLDGLLSSSRKRQQPQEFLLQEPPAASALKIRPDVRGKSRLPSQRKLFCNSRQIRGELFRRNSL